MLMSIISAFFECCSYCWTSGEYRALQRVLTMELVMREMPPDCKWLFHLPGICIVYNNGRV